MDFVKLKEIIKYSLLFLVPIPCNLCMAKDLICVYRLINRRKIDVKGCTFSDFVIFKVFSLQYLCRVPTETGKTGK